MPRPPCQTQFKNLLFRRGEPRFYAFDLLWCEGEDLRYGAAPKIFEAALPECAILYCHKAHRNCTEEGLCFAKLFC